MAVGVAPYTMLIDVDQMIGGCFAYTKKGSNPRNNGIRAPLLASSSALSCFHITPTSPATYFRVIILIYLFVMIHILEYCSHYETPCIFPLSK